MIENKHLQLLHNRLNLAFKSIENTIKLLNEGATIPFISRYRKELTGSLDEVEVAAIANQYQKLLELEKRKETIINAIDEQGKMTDALMKRILETYDATELEDIYLPYKKKKKTRAMIAIECGLEPLAKKIIQQAYIDVKKEASTYINDKILTIEDALNGAKDIIAEWVNENEQARQKVRYLFNKSAVMSTKMVKGKEIEGSKFKDYFEYSEPLSKCPSHRILAARRGEDEGILRVSITPLEDPFPVLENIYIKEHNDCGMLIKEAIADAYKRLMEPSIENEYRNISKEKADKEAIKVFVDNLRQLLLEAPLGQKRVMGIDPGFRTGCKVVCLDNNGDLLHNTTIYPHTAGVNNNNSSKDIQHLVHLYAIDAIAVGNGTAGKETISFLKKISFEDEIDIFMVNESGASIYSASEVAREEFPDYDLTVRGAVSIGRRLMDPLAELIKIDAKSIGVGQYQHDVDQSELRKSLDLTVESCVNKVGINLNTASKHLLTYISGVGPALAQNIVSYR
ncbi:MAG TPA: Tex-like N-terminal domain-containing protein, partial [Saprospiraceae bacterium]|nr:Tex-like N-terminal domain-containing protein [Saprospiraceae bacterium]